MFSTRGSRDVGKNSDNCLIPRQKQSKQTNFLNESQASHVIHKLIFKTRLWKLRGKAKLVLLMTTDNASTNPLGGIHSLV